MLKRINLLLALIGVLSLAGVVSAQTSTSSDGAGPPLPAGETPKPTDVSQAAPDPKWEFSVTPYLFLARLNGTVGVLGQTAQVNASFSDIFRNLNFAAMGTFEARKGNWFVLVDGMYISLSGKRVTPSPLFSDIDVEVKETVITPEAGYRVM